MRPTLGAVVDGRRRAEYKVGADLGHGRRLGRLEVLATAEAFELFTELLRRVTRVLGDWMTGRHRHQNDLQDSRATKRTKNKTRKPS